MTSLSRMRAGNAVRKNSRTSSRKAVSSGVKRRSMRGSFSCSVLSHDAGRPGRSAAKTRDPLPRAGAVDPGSPLRFGRDDPEKDGTGAHEASRIRAFSRSSSTSSFFESLPTAVRGRWSRMSSAGHGFEETTEEVGRDPRRGFLVQLDEGELRSAVDGDEQVELALLGPDLGDVDMEVADRVALELAPIGLVAVDLRQPADPMTLKAAMQG